MSRDALLLKRAFDVVVASLACSCSCAPLLRGDRALDQARLARAGAVPADTARARPAPVHGSTSSGRCGRTRRPDEHREYIRRAMDARRVVRRRTASSSSSAPTSSRGPAAGCARRASTSCRSSSTSCAATCRSSARGRASRTRPSTFEPHHFERFSVPAGMTGLWQVKARARSPFVEALELDVLYARSWSFWARHRAAAQDARADLPAEGDPMSAPLRVAVVGLGYWGPNLLRNLVELDDAEVVTMCDQRDERLEHWGKRYPAVATTTSYLDVLSRRPGRRGRDRDSRLDPLRPRLAGAAVRQAHLRREAARGAAPRRRPSSCGSPAAPAAC